MDEQINSTTDTKQSMVEGAEHKTRVKIALVGFVLFLIFVVGLFWLATTPEQTVGLTLSFAAGLSMIFLPCTLPLAFVIVPMTLGKNPKKGFLMALFFGLGLTITLSLYGVFVAALGKTFGLKSDVEVYAVLFGGIAALIFGLSEIGLLKFKLPSYSGKFPDFIQRQKDYVKTFLLGLLLGNAGVGCPNPAFYILLGYIATTADLFNGWFLGFVHGLGRSVPLIFLAILGALGVNTLSGVSRHKDAVERAMGWALVIIGAYLLTFGIFGHDWFIASGFHSTWEQFVSNIGGERFGEVILKHEHKLIDIPNFIQYGNMFFLGLLALIFLIAFIAKRPSRTTIKWLTITYILIALFIGYSTGWTFKTGTNIHIQFRSLTDAPQDHGIGAPEGHDQGETVNFYEETSVKNGLVVNFNATPTPALIEVPTRLDFFVNKKPENAPIPFSNLAVFHQKLMHVIGIRSDLNEFFHIHPVSMLEEQGKFTIEHIFLKPGLYKIWSEVKSGGKEYAFGHPEFNVQGNGPKEDKQISFGTNAIVGDYQVALERGVQITKGQEAHFSFDVRTLTGGGVSLADYLGESMHLILIRDDLKEFIHAHPEGSDEHLTSIQLFEKASAHGIDENEIDSKKVSFHVIFPAEGLYKAFAQFRPLNSDLPEDEALVAEFWIKVEKQSVSYRAQWWGLLIVSLLFIIILSWLVNKYLRAMNVKQSQEDFQSSR